MYVYIRMTWLGCEKLIPTSGCPGAKLRGPPPLVHTAQGRPREVRVCGQGLCGEGFFLVFKGCQARRRLLR